MRPFRHAVSSMGILILATGALVACSSSSGKPVTDGGDGGGTGGAGGSNADAGPDAPKDAPAVVDTGVDMPVSEAGGFDAPFADGATSPANITLTIPALAGGTFPDANTCAGINVSPQMSWTAGPTGTMSYAVVLTDTFQNAAHWVIWDIPATAMMLPAGLPGTATLTDPAGAKQLHKTAFFMAGFDYRGPCPSGATHTYTFEITAVPTATLTLGPNPTTEQIRAVLQNVGIGHGDVMATSNATMRPADAGGQ